MKQVNLKKKNIITYKVYVSEELYAFKTNIDYRSELQSRNELYIIFQVFYLLFSIIRILFE